MVWGGYFGSWRPHLTDMFIYSTLSGFGIVFTRNSAMSSAITVFVSPAQLSA